ncbi:ATPase [Croceicoccus marinus]|jgi:F-type H+-transporting ATPase subunit b|uniref:ATP synthase subunit b n=1 Tax=Croceicoccus marinus TaxID=450378 RepID=A0A7G6VRI0_9SPHN|nr:ATPase [Croceicoccus marinus]QNE04345.1 ATPase [Croceicoccus marinus]
MPQISQLAATYASQVFWLLIFFGLTYFVIGRGMVPKVMDTVAMRDKQIADDLSSAEAARRAADEQEEAWRVRENENRARAQELIAEAKAKAAAETEARLGRAQTGIDATLEAAEARIAEAREKAAAEIEGIAAEATQSIVARVAGLTVDDTTARSAVRKELA